MSNDLKTRKRTTNSNASILAINKSEENHNLVQFLTTLIEMDKQHKQWLEKNKKEGA